MSPELLIATASVQLQADPRRAPRSVAFPDGDHSTASVPSLDREYPTLCPASLMAKAMLS